MPSLLNNIFGSGRRQPVSIIVRSPNGNAIPFVLDITIQETHNLSASVTQLPVEQGSNITDNVVLNNNTVSFEGFISDSSSTALNQAVNIGAGSLDRLLPSSIGTGLAFASSLGPRIQRRDVLTFYFRELKRIFESRQVFKMIFSFTSYDNLLFTSLSVPRSARDGRSLRFNASVTEVRVISREIVSSIDILNDLDISQASLNLGKQEKTNITDSNGFIRAKSSGNTGLGFYDHTYGVS